MDSGLDHHRHVLEAPQEVRAARSGKRTDQRLQFPVALHSDIEGLGPKILNSDLAF